MFNTLTKSRSVRTLVLAAALSIGLSAVAPKKSEAGVAMMALSPLTGGTSGALFVVGLIGASTGAVSLLFGCALFGCFEPRNSPYRQQQYMPGEDAPAWAMVALIALDSPSAVQAGIESELVKKYPALAQDRALARDLATEIISKLDRAEADAHGEKRVRFTAAEAQSIVDRSDLGNDPRTARQIAKLVSDLQ